MLGFFLPTQTRSLPLPVLIPLRDLVYLLFVQSCGAGNNSSVLTASQIERFFCFLKQIAVGEASLLPASSKKLF
jgi:hypothetical protein